MKNLYLNTGKVFENLLFNSSSNTENLTFEDPKSKTLKNFFLYIAQN